MNLPIVCIAKAVRTLGFGAVSVVLALFLIEKGFSASEIGVLFSLTLLEDAFITTLASVLAHRIGMRTVLLLSSLLVLIGGCAIAFAHAKWLLAIAVIFGIVSPAGYEGGPFAAIEQAIISQSVKRDKLTPAFSWYNLVGFGGAAIGSLIAGGCVAALKGQPPVVAYQTIFLLYAATSFVLAILYMSADIVDDLPRQSEKSKVQIERESLLSAAFRSAGEAWQNTKDAWKTTFSGPGESKKYIRNLAFLQGLDAFGGGFVVQSLLTCWFYQRYHVDATFLGPVFFGCNVIAAFSFVLAPFVVKRVGLLNSMVFTHLPCSLSLCLLPFLPSASFAAGLLLIRSLFSSMDIPARQAYTMLIVSEKERPIAAGAITSARAIAQGIAPCLTGFLMNNAVTGIPLVLAGAFKSVYDVSLYHAFKHVPFYHATAQSAPPIESPSAEEESRTLDLAR